MRAAGKKDGERSKARVYIRIRPFDERERQLSLGAEPTPIVATDGKICTIIPTQSSYAFTGVLWSVNRTPPPNVPYADQNYVYDTCASKCLDAALNGQKSIIFAYGQTGSGKTYTMTGTKDEPGIVPRIQRELFNRIAALKTWAASANRSCNVSVKVWYVEVYNETVQDLLTGAQLGFSTMSNDLAGMEVSEVSSAEEIAKVVMRGDARRHSAATAMNERSSRSHAVLQLHIKVALGPVGSAGSGAMAAALASSPPGKGLASMYGSMDGEQRLTAPGVRESYGTLSLVDLAGSERTHKSGAEGLVKEEATQINQSLLSLRIVLQHLVAERKCTTRSSVLTHLLRDGLNGSGHVVLIGTISPHADNKAESAATIDFCSLTSKVVNYVTSNVVNEGGLGPGDLAGLQDVAPPIDVPALVAERDRLQSKVGDLNDLVSRLFTSTQMNQEELHVSKRRVDEQRRMIASGLLARVLSRKVSGRVTERLETEVKRLQDLSVEQSELVDALRRQNVTRQFVHAIRLHKVNEDKASLSAKGAVAIDGGGGPAAIGRGGGGGNASADIWQMGEGPVDVAAMRVVSSFLSSLDITDKAAATAARVFEVNHIYTLASLRSLSQDDLRELIPAVGVRNAIAQGLTALAAADSARKLANGLAGTSGDPVRPTEPVGHAVFAISHTYAHYNVSLAGGGGHAGVHGTFTDAAIRTSRTLSSAFGAQGFATTDLSVGPPSELLTKRNIFATLRAKRDSLASRRSRLPFFAYVSAISAANKYFSGTLPSHIAVSDSNPLMPASLLPTDLLLSAVASPVYDTEIGGRHAAYGAVSDPVGSPARAMGGLGASQYGGTPLDLSSLVERGVSITAPTSILFLHLIATSTTHFPASVTAALPNSGEGSSIPPGVVVIVCEGPPESVPFVALTLLRCLPLAAADVVPSTVERLVQVLRSNLTWLPGPPQLVYNLSVYTDKHHNGQIAAPVVALTNGSLAQTVVFGIDVGVSIVAPALRDPSLRLDAAHATLEGVTTGAVVMLVDEAEAVRVNLTLRVFGDDATASQLSLSSRRTVGISGGFAGGAPGQDFFGTSVTPKVAGGDDGGSDAAAERSSSRFVGWAALCAINDFFTTRGCAVPELLGMYTIKSASGGALRVLRLRIPRGSYVVLKDQVVGLDFDIPGLEVIDLQEVLACRVASPLAAWLGLEAARMKREPLFGMTIDGLGLPIADAAAAAAIEGGSGHAGGHGDIVLGGGGGGGGDMGIEGVAAAIAGGHPPRWASQRSHHSALPLGFAHTGGSQWNHGASVGATPPPHGHAHGMGIAPHSLAQRSAHNSGSPPLGLPVADSMRNVSPLSGPFGSAGAYAAATNMGACGLDRSAGGGPGGVAGEYFRSTMLRAGEAGLGDSVGAGGVYSPGHGFPRGRDGFGPSIGRGSSLAIGGGRSGAGAALPGDAIGGLGLGMSYPRAADLGDDAAAVRSTLVGVTQHANRFAALAAKTAQLARESASMHAERQRVRAAQDAAGAGALDLSPPPTGTAAYHARLEDEVEVMRQELDESRGRGGSGIEAIVEADRRQGMRRMRDSVPL